MDNFNRVVNLLRISVYWVTVVTAFIFVGGLFYEGVEGVSGLVEIYISKDCRVYNNGGVTGEDVCVSLNDRILLKKMDIYPPFFPCKSSSNCNIGGECIINTCLFERNPFGYPCSENKHCESGLNCSGEKCISDVIPSNVAGNTENGDNFIFVTFVVENEQDNAASRGIVYLSDYFNRIITPKYDLHPRFEVIEEDELEETSKAEFQDTNAVYIMIMDTNEGELDFFHNNGAVNYKKKNRQRKLNKISNYFKKPYVLLLTLSEDCKNKKTINLDRIIVDNHKNGILTNLKRNDIIEVALDSNKWFTENCISENEKNVDIENFFFSMVEWEFSGDIGNVGLQKCLDECKSDSFNCRAVIEKCKKFLKTRMVTPHTPPTPPPLDPPTPTKSNWPILCGSNFDCGHGKKCTGILENKFSVCLPNDYFGGESVVCGEYMSGLESVQDVRCEVYLRHAVLEQFVFAMIISSFLLFVFMYQVYRCLCCIIWWIWVELKLKRE